MDLNIFYESFANLDKNESFKWNTYFTAYENLLHGFIGKREVSLLEIGVSRGGSLDMWSKVFGKDACIVGIDIDPACLEASHSDNVHVRIVDQNDEESLVSICKEYNGFDIVIDDGAHTDKSIICSLHAMWPYVKDNGIYIIEDLHGTFWGESGWNFSNSVVELLINEFVSMQRMAQEAI